MRKKQQKFRAGIFSAITPDLTFGTGACICRSSYAEYSAWSRCSGTDDWCLEFSGGEWLKDAVPCFTDLYMMLVGRDGTKHAGCVRARVRV